MLNKFIKANSQSYDIRRLMQWFFILYEIPWILRWNYSIPQDNDPDWDYIPYLERQLYIKWWDRYNAAHLQPSTFNMQFVAAQLMVSASTTSMPMEFSTHILALKHRHGDLSKEEFKKQILEALDNEDLGSQPSSSKTFEEEEIKSENTEDLNANGDDCFGMI